MWEEEEEDEEDAEEKEKKDSDAIFKNKSFIEESLSPSLYLSLSLFYAFLFV